MTWTRIIVAAALFVGLSAQSRAADTYMREELRIPLPATGPRGLEALLVRPSEPGRYPLALLSHGAPRSPADRPKTVSYTHLDVYKRQGVGIVAVGRIELIAGQRHERGKMRTGGITNKADAVGIEVEFGGFRPYELDLSLIHISLWIERRARRR